MWINEVVDKVMNDHFDLMVNRNIFSLYHNPPRMIRTTKQTKNDIKTIFEIDENLFWDDLAYHHKSLTGYIRRMMNLTRSKVKKCHKLLIKHRKAQSVFNKWITGDLFKKFILNSPAVPFCSRCINKLNTLEHFISCSGFLLLSPKFRGKVTKWKEICTNYSSHFFK